MKKILCILSLFFIFSCKMANVNEKVIEDYKKVIKFYNFDNEEIKIKSNDEFNKAFLEYDNKLIPLDRENSASGVIMSNKEKNIMFFFEEYRYAFMKINGSSMPLYQRKLIYRDYGKDEKISIARVSSNELVLKMNGKYHVFYRMSSEDEYFYSQNNDLKLSFTDDDIKIYSIDIDGNVLDMREILK